MVEITKDYREMYKLAEALSKDEKCPVCRKKAIDKHIENMIVLNQLLQEQGEFQNLG